MRCAICDNVLADDEVRFNRDHKDYDPCGTCKNIIKDVFKEDRDEGTLRDVGDAFDGGTTELEAMLGIEA